MSDNNRFWTSGRMFAAGLVLGLVVAMGTSVKADFLGNIWKGIATPLADNTLAAISSLKVTPKTTPTAAPPIKPVADYEQAMIAAVKKVSPAVVSITVSKNVPIIEQCPYNPFGNLPPEFQGLFGNDSQFYTPCQKGSELKEVGGGSGFIITPDGMVVTNKHVVSDKDAAYTVFTNDGKKYEAKVLALDPVQDLAIVKISGSALPTVELGDSDKLELGQTVIAIGNALGEFRNTVSAGVVSGLARTVTATDRSQMSEETIRGVIQTDAAINPGNSGGPLLNLTGQVVGINTAVAAGAQNIGFALPINRVKKNIDSVRAIGKIEVAYLGVRYIELNADTAKKQNVKVEEGALLRGGDDGPAIAPGSPAATAGLLAEDIITHVNGKKIDRNNTLGDYIAQARVGETLILTIRRGDKVMNINITLAKRPE